MFLREVDLRVNKERYFVGCEDGKSIFFSKEENGFVSVDITIKSKYVFAVIVCIVTIVGGVRHNSTTCPEHNSAEIEDAVAQNQVKSPIDDEGFVFERSSGEVLSKEMVLALKADETIGFQRLLRMAINEIYARHGQLFNAGEVNDMYYQKYEWYEETDKHLVEWDEFNDIEKTNLRLLLSVEEEYGYR